MNIEEEEEENDYYSKFIYGPKKETAISLLKKMKIRACPQMVAIASEFLRINQDKTDSDVSESDESESDDDN